MGDFSVRDIESLDVAHRAQWEALIKSHADAVRIEARAIRKELEPIFFATQIGETSGPANNIIATDSDWLLDRSIDRLFKMTSEGDETILSAFTVSGKSDADVIAETRKLRQSLLQLEALAAQVSNLR